MACALRPALGRQRLQGHDWQCRMVVTGPRDEGPQVEVLKSWMACAYAAGVWPPFDNDEPMSRVGDGT